MDSGLKGHRGFSLLEVLVALFIFSVGILAVASMQSTVTRTTGFSGSLMRATALARDRMELLQAAPRTELLNPASNSMVRCGENLTIGGTVVYDPRCAATLNGTYRVDLRVEVDYPGSMRTFAVRLDSSRFVTWP